MPKSKYYWADLENNRAKGRRTMARSRAVALELLGGPVCVSCGCDAAEALEIDHVGGGGCRLPENERKRLPRAISAGELNLDGFRVLCRVCNNLEYIQRKYPELRGRWEVRWVE
jgi:hypothetical protein